MTASSAAPSHLIYNRAYIMRVVFKTLFFFVLLNLCFALTNAILFINQLSLYNSLLPGRLRLPYGEDTRAYNLSLSSLDAMFASHKVASPADRSEYRVLVVGDSSVWGILLKPEETLTGQINNAQLRLPDNRIIRAYNLGHPVLSLTKDLLILEQSLNYEPDLIVWLTTLHAFPREKQLSAPIVQQHARRIQALFQKYDLTYDLSQLSPDPSLLDNTIVGQRRSLADWLRLQLYGVMWAVTGVDQYYPPAYEPRTADFEADVTYEKFLTPQPLTVDDLAFDVLDAGIRLAGETPVLLVNEPIFISTGRNSDLRYNLWYPRWAYDTYRALFAEVADQQSWRYLDLWNWINAAEFTDSPVHLTPQGTQRLAEHLGAEIIKLALTEEKMS
jgi:hypothetical protein